MPGNYYGYSAQAPDFSFIGRAGQQIGQGINEYQKTKLENLDRSKVLEAYHNVVIPNAIKEYNESTGNTDPMKAEIYVGKIYYPPLKSEKPGDTLSRWATVEKNFKSGLESLKGEKANLDIGQTVARATASSPGVQGSLNPEADKGWAAIDTSNAPDVNIGPAIYDSNSYPEPGVEAPKTKEEFNARVSQDLPPSTTTEQLNANAQYQTAARSFPGMEDDLAKARLKLQQDQEARKREQINKSNETQATKAKIASDRLAFDHLKLAVESGQTNEKLAQGAAVLESEYAKDLAKAEGRWKELDSKLKILTDPTKSDEAMMMDETLDQVQGNMAELSPIIGQLQDRKKMAEQFVTKLTAEGSVYERTTRAKKTNKQRTTPMTPPATGPAPAQSRKFKIINVTQKP